MATGLPPAAMGQDGLQMNPRGGRQAVQRAIGIGTLLTLLSASLASALNFGSSFAHICDTTNASQCKANDSFHGIIISVSGAYRTQVLAVMADYNSVAPPTAMTEVVIPGPSGYDVEVLLVNAGANNILAWTQCQGAVGAPGMAYGGSDTLHTRWCRPQKFFYNTFYAAGYFPDDPPKRYIACHELGHTIGLRHWQSNGGSEPSSTCMRTATITPKFVPTFGTTSSHDRSNIAAGY